VEKYSVYSDSNGASGGRGIMGLSINEVEGCELESSGSGLGK